MPALFKKYPHLSAYIIGLAVLVLGFIIIYTQIILREVGALGLTITPAIRLQTTLDNIGSGMFIFLTLVLGLGFTLAMIVAARIARLVRILPNWVHALAGFAAVLLILQILQIWRGINLIPAARELPDMLMLGGAGALSGYIYRALIERNRP